jgi:HK97 family phage major capsid protein
MSKVELLNQRSQIMEDWGKILAITERELTPEEAQMVADLSAKVDDIDARLKVMEAEYMDQSAMDSEEKKPAMNSKPIGELREEHAKRIQTRKVNPAPGYVRDYNDRQSIRDSNLAFRGWCMGREATDEQKAAAQRAGLNLDGPLFVNPNQTEEQRAQSTSGTSGGYMIPQGFLAELERKRLAFNPLRGVARVIRTDSGNSMPMPTVDDTAITGALVAENTATSPTDYTLGQITFGAYTYKSVVNCSLELLQDSGLNLGSIVGELLGERLGRSEAAAFATGTGSSQPQGVVVGASAGKTTASATAITINEIYDLVNSLDAAYQPNASFMFHQTVWTYLLKLQDSTGFNLIQRNLGYAEAAGPKLLGYPVVINNNMNAAITTGLITGIFGDLSKFYIRDAGPIVIRRSDDFLFTSNAASFMAVERFDSKVIQSAAIKKLTQA